MGRTKVGVGDRNRQSSRTKLGIRDVGHRAPRGLIGKLVLGRFRVEAELGYGAMGTVYRGIHEPLARPVAIKVLHAHFGREPTMLARFHREARAAARLLHPNVAGVIDVGEDVGRQIMVLEFAEGPSLAEQVGEPFPVERVVHLTAELLGALDHAHTAGVVHRDLKPENIIVTRAPDGREVPRIVDFGIAALREQDPTKVAKLTASGVIIGTPAYMAPEQAQGEPIDHRVDLFGLGVIAYEMLAGTIPFDGSSMEIALAYISKEPPAIAARAPGVDVPSGLEAFVRTLMARRAADRFASARDALVRLGQVARDPHADARKASALIGLPDPPVVE